MSARSTVTMIGSSHALSFRFTELLALGGLLAVVSDEISRKLDSKRQGKEPAPGFAVGAPPSVEKIYPWTQFLQ